MADLRIVDAPEIPTENITGAEKLPTGGSGNYSISLDSLADYTKTKKDLADNTTVDNKVNGVRQELDAHIEDLLNPHQVTKGQIGLGNVDNTADADKPVSNSTQSAIISAVAPKANKADVYTKQESSDLVNNSISTALTPVNVSLDLAKRGIANRYDPLLTYNSGERVVLTNGDIVKSTIDGNVNNPNTDLTGWVKVNSASQIFDESGKSQQEINGFIKAKNLVSITDFGAKGDGVTDDSNAIQAALDTGFSIFIPEANNFWKVTRRMELKAVGQKVYGIGYKSLVKMINALVCESVFRAGDLGKNRFENVYAIPSVDGTLNWGGGVGFMLQRSHGSSVVNCEVSDHRGGGVSLLGSSYCYLSGNHIHDSVVVEDEEIGRWGNDITVNNGSFNIIDNNRCINGSGIGIAVQNLLETDISNSNKITNNIVKDQPVYGIMLYKKFAADQIVGNEIRNNTVENITGSIREPLGYAYGCGIYIQTAEHSIVDGNTVKDAMGRSKDGTLPHEIHTPAGIGIANVANAIVTNNKVIDSGWYGIQAISSIALSVRGAGIKISDNDVQGSNRAGVYVQDIPKVSINGNTVNQKTGSQAVIVRQNVLSQSVFALVSNNEMYSDNVCFESIGDIKLVKLDDNTIEGTAAGYSVQLGGVRVEAVGNYIDPSVAAASGIRVGANVVTGLVDDNDIIKGNIGIGYASATTGNVFIGDKNRNNASIPFYNGSSQSMWRPLENTATPSVQGINLAIQNNATNITNLTGSVRSQRVILKAGVAFTLVNGATMKLSGGTNFAMAVGNLITLFNDDGIWREESRSLTA